MLSRGWQVACAVAVAVLTAGLFAAAFPRPAVPEAAYVALAPLLIWLVFLRPGVRIVLWTSLAAGFGQWVVLLWWLRHFPLQVGLSPLLGYLAVIALAGVLALFFLAWAMVARWLLVVEDRGVAYRIVAMFGLAGGWVLLEWVRSWLFTGFPWLPLAASQWQRPLLLQMASVTGAWGISFVLVLFNLGLAFYVRNLVRTRRKVWFKRFSLEFYLGLGGIFLAVAAGFNDMSPYRDRPMFVAGFIQPYILPPERWNPDTFAAVQEDYALVCRYAVFDGAEAILWPEASTPLPAPGHPAGEEWLAGLSHDLGVPILLGNLARRDNPEGDTQWFNAVVKVTPEGGVAQEFGAKRHLVPFGEYAPSWLPFLEAIVPVGQFTPGTEPAVLSFPVRERNWRVGALICYEDLFPSLARDLAREGVDFIFVATNDAWYGEEGAAYQHAAHSVLRAVETRRPVIRSGNAGWSGWIDERGQIRHVLVGADRTVYFQGADATLLERNPAFVDHLTFYVRWGDWFVAVSGVLAVMALGLRRWWPVPPQAAR
ncbi:MAG: apolipoprotein N-acyltransferase [Opitutales bacterium]